VEQLTRPAGYLVRFIDLRYDYPDRLRPRRVTLGARVLLNPQLQVIAEQFGARSQRPDLVGPQPENGGNSK
jgi:hypothetical protein